MYSLSLIHISKNERDVEEISTEITKGLEIKFVTHMDEVLKEALV